VKQRFLLFETSFGEFPSAKTVGSIICLFHLLSCKIPMKTTIGLLLSQARSAQLHMRFTFVFVKSNKHTSVPQ